MVTIVLNLGRWLPLSFTAFATPLIFWFLWIANKFCLHIYHILTFLKCSMCIASKFFMYSFSKWLWCGNTVLAMAVVNERCIDNDFFFQIDTWALFADIIDVFWLEITYAECWVNGLLQYHDSLAKWRSRVLNDVWDCDRHCNLSNFASSTVNW